MDYQPHPWLPKRGSGPLTFLPKAPGTVWTYRHTPLPPVPSQPGQGPLPGLLPIAHTHSRCHTQATPFSPGIRMGKQFEKSSYHLTVEGLDLKWAADRRDNRLSLFLQNACTSPPLGDPPSTNKIPFQLSSGQSVKVISTWHFNKAFSTYYL